MIRTSSGHRAALGGRRRAAGRPRGPRDRWL